MNSQHPRGAQSSFAAGLPAQPEFPGTSAPGGPRPLADPDPSGPGSKISRRWLIIPFLIGALGGYTLYRQQERQTRAEARGPVPTVKVERGEMTRKLRVGGTVSARRSFAVVAPRLRGRRGSGRFRLTLLSMAKPGSMVKKGDIVAEFDRQLQQQTIDDQHAEVVQAQADIDKNAAELAIAWETTQQELRSARAEWDKAMLDLRTGEVRSRIEAEILKLNVEETEAAFRQLQKEVKLLKVAQAAKRRSLEISRDQKKIDENRARINADKMVLRAGISGMVVMQTIFRGGGQFSQVQEGDEVNSGAFFMQIVDTSSMIVNGQLNQVDSQGVQVGQRAEIRLDAYPDKVWPGRVTAVAAIAGGGGGMRGPRSMTRAEYVRSVPVTFAIEAQAPEISPDLSAGADVLLEEHSNVVTVPREAVQLDEGGEEIVFVRKPGDGDFEARSIETGARNNVTTVVTAGLDAGEEIALRRPPLKL